MGHGTLVINSDDDKKTSYFFGKKGKKYVKLIFGTKEGTEYLKQSGIDLFVYGCDPTFFVIEKKKSDLWIAFDVHEDGSGWKKNSELSYKLGRSKDVNYSSLHKAYAYLNKKGWEALRKKEREEKKKRKKEKKGSRRTK